MKKIILILSILGLLNICLIADEVVHYDKKDTKKVVTKYDIKPNKPATIKPNYPGKK